MNFIKLILLLFPLATFAKTNLHIAVASNFAAPIKELIQIFESKTNNKVLLSLGPSGRFYSQITNGAPFDIFLSADSFLPNKLIENALATKESYITYAKGSLVIYSMRKKVKNILNNSDFSQIKRIAIANPKLAPYGMAALEVLKNLNLYHKYQTKLVQGQNVIHTYQIVESGNADFGIISKSLVHNKKNYWQIPQNLYPEIHQGAVVINNSKNKNLANKFISFLKSDSAQKIIKRYGYKI